MNILSKIKNIIKTKKEEPSAPYLPKDEIFREYDIRGIYNSSLFDKDAFLIGKSFSSMIVAKNKKKIIVGYDGRNSSLSLVKHLIAGITSSGCHAINIGLSPTPLLYFSVNEYNADAGIMVTGSHNPKNYNGFKVIINSENVLGDEIKNIKEIIRKRSFTDDAGREIIIQAMQKAYIKKLIERVNIVDNVKVAWDIGNGATSNVIKDLVKKIPGVHVLLSEEIDGEFPDRDPDPTIEKNLINLITFVKKNNFDIGIAFDGDGDRIGVVTALGKMIYGDQLLSVYAREILKSHQGAYIITDVKASNLVIEDIKKHGGIPVMGKVGHSIIKSKISEIGALLAGEMSGHMFFSDKWYGFDDGIYAALRLLEIFSNHKNIGVDTFQDIPSGINTPEIRINCDESEKFLIINKIKSILAGMDIKFIDLDGIRVESDIGWWLIRASNTQNQLTIRAESATKNGLKSLIEQIQNYLSMINVDLANEFIVYMNPNEFDKL